MRSVGLQSSEGTDDPLDRAGEPTGHIRCRERSVRAGVPRHQRLQRMRHRLGEGQRQTERKVAAERVAIAGRVFGGDEPRFAAELDLDHPASLRADPRATRSTMPSQRRSTSAAVRSPTLRNTSCSSSALLARRPSATHCSSSSTSAEHTGIEQLAQLLGTQTGRGADRGRATTPPPGARPTARRLRTCTRRSS